MDFWVGRQQLISVIWIWYVGLVDPGLLTEEQVALEELKFAALVEEFRYLIELKILIQLATRAVSWDDPLVPSYHKRAIVHSLHKGVTKLIKKFSQTWIVFSSEKKLRGCFAHGRAALVAESDTSKCSFHPAWARGQSGRLATNLHRILLPPLWTEISIHSFNVTTIYFFLNLGLKMLFLL